MSLYLKIGKTEIVNEDDRWTGLSFLKMRSLCEPRFVDGVGSVLPSVIAELALSSSFWQIEGIVLVTRWIQVRKNQM